MNILHLANTVDPRSGWGRLSREVIERLIQRGHTIDLLTEVASNDPTEQPILKRSWKALLGLPEIRRHIKKADLVHAWEANPYGIVSYLAGLGIKKPKIIIATGAYSIQPLYNRNTSTILKKTYRDADRVVCISKYIEDEIKRVVPEAKTEVVTLGVDFNRFSGERRVPKERFILGVGNVGSRKGYQVSIPAFAEVAKRIPDIKYFIAGIIENELHPKLQAQIKTLGLEDRVIFLGSLDDTRLKELYLSAELFILTSVNLHHHFEGFGLVFLEAASAGLPVIGTTGNGIRDAINEGKNGILVPQYDEHATAEAIIRILENPELKQRFSTESITWAKRNSWDNTVDQYTRIYDEVRKPYLS